MLLMSSMMSTVLPTPAPPNSKVNMDPKEHGSAEGSKCALVYGQMNEPPGARARVRRRDAAEQRRHLGARLREAEDVVDEEQHVLALVAR
jgi:hypothetical protein